MATKRYIYATSSGVYSTDGTSAGTTLLVAAGADFVPQPGTPMVTLPNGKVLFFGLVNPSLDIIGAITSGIRIWETDGTVAGTALTGTTVPPDGLTIPGDYIGNVEAIGNQVSFAFQIPGSSPATAQTFITDGTTGGTIPQNNTVLSQFGLPSTGAVTGGSSAQRYVYATSAGVYSSDGTDAGTTLLVAAGADFVPQPGTPMITLPNGKVLFFGLVNPSLDTIGALISGIRIWETDGTVAGTALTGTTVPPDGLTIPGDYIGNVEAIGNQVSFAFQIPGSSPATAQTFITDGTTGGTFPQNNTVLSQFGLPSTGALTGGSSAARFIYATSAGVYSSDGTDAGTTLLVAAGADFVPQPGTPMITLPNGKVLFFALVNPSLDLIGALTSGIRIWETDGTVAGTTQTGTSVAPDGLTTVGDNIDNVVAIGTEVSFAFNIPSSGSVLYATDGTTAGTVTAPTTLPQTGLTGGSNTLCFLAGTKIATPGGEVPVQQLTAGGDVLTASGEVREIRWIGKGRVLAMRGRRSAATPVIVRKGALADNVPNADLRMTMAHGLYIDDVLIPVEFLVNHRSILWDDHAQEVELYHVELDRHDILIANGAPAESYRDDGNRWLFHNANEGWHLPPSDACAPVLTGGTVVDAAWRRFLDRAGSRRLPPMTDDADLHLVADGQRIDPTETAGLDIVFHIPSTARAVRLVSRDVAPAELGLARDPRSLGVAVRRIAIERRSNRIAIGASDPCLMRGFHDYEADGDLRWTDGDAALSRALFALPGVGAFKLTVTLAATVSYPDWGDSGVRAA